MVLVVQVEVNLLAMGDDQIPSNSDFRGIDRIFDQLFEPEMG